MNLLDAYIKDLKVEMVKLQMQLCSPHEQFQRHDLLGRINFEDLDVNASREIFQEAIFKLQAASSYEELFDIFNELRTTRQTIQYEGYYNSTARKTRAWCYVLVDRLLKRHKKLYNEIYGR